MKAIVRETGERVNVELKERDFHDEDGDIFYDSEDDPLASREWYRYELEIKE